MTDPPTIVGAGLSGLVVSRALSRAGRPHRLIGPPPDGRPRLGESINLEGSIDLTEFWGEYAHRFYRKKSIVAFFAHHTAECNFEIARDRASAILFWLLGVRAPAEFLHVDRIGFDDDLFTDAVAAPECHHIPQTIASVDFDPATDRVTGLSLPSGEILRPRFVFDATNHVRLIARAAGLETEVLSEPQRVVYTHFETGDSGGTCPDAPWIHSTNLLRLYRERDGIDGFAWCIPLGRTVSIGVNLDDRETRFSEPDLLDLVERLYAAEGLGYRSLYPEAGPVRSLRHQYFSHHRCAGANWLLVGPSFCQIWFMSSTGVGSALAAAHIADKIIDDPERWGRHYGRYLEQLPETHHIHAWFRTSPGEEMTSEAIASIFDQLARTNMRRLARYGRLVSPGPRVAFQRLFYEIFSTELLIRDFCRVERSTRCDER